MVNQSHFPPTSKAPLKLAGTFLLAAGVTFSLFAVMQQLISSDPGPIVEPEPLPVITMVYSMEDKPVVEKQEIKPLPEPKKVPAPLPQLVEAEPDDLGNGYQPVIAKVGFKNTFQNNFHMLEGDTRPIVRMQPKYPIDAARNGVEGWVKLVFSIDSSGQVKDVEVIDSQPKRTFDRAAKQALKKWKYKPKVIDGKAVIRQGLQVVLDFKLDSNAA